VLVQGRRRRFSRVGPGPLVKEQAYMSNGTLGWPRPSGRVTRSVRYVRLVLSISMSVKSGINSFKKYYLLFTCDDLLIISVIPPIKHESE
jgi:hypothetical protein